MQDLSLIIYSDWKHCEVFKMKEFSIGGICGLEKPKFKRISEAIPVINFDEGVDVYFDLNTIISALKTSKTFLSKLPFSEDAEADIISSVLGILLHWKKFFYGRTNVRYFFIQNDFEICGLAEQPTMKTYLVPYVNDMGLDRYKQMVYYWSEAIKKIEIILKYVPGSYFIRCDRFDSYVVPNLITTNDRNRIIITGNPFFTSYVYMDKTHILYTKYNYASKCPNQLDDPLMIVQSISKIDEDIMETFIKNKVFYNLLSSIIGDRDRNIIGLTQMGLSSFAIDLLRAVERHEIPENPSSIESVLPAIKPTFHKYLRQVYPLVDIESHTKMVTPSMIEKMKTTIVDMYDVDAFAKLSVNDFCLMDLIR